MYFSGVGWSRPLSSGAAGVGPMVGISDPDSSTNNRLGEIDRVAMIHVRSQ